jgi:hypothetical protein
MVGSLFSWKSLFTNRKTSEDYAKVVSMLCIIFLRHSKSTFPTAASPRRTSLTLLLGLGALPESAMVAMMLKVVCGLVREKMLTRRR